MWQVDIAWKLFDKNMDGFITKIEFFWMTNSDRLDRYIQYWGFSLWHSFKGAPVIVALSKGHQSLWHSLKFSLGNIIHNHKKNCFIIVAINQWELRWQGWRGVEEGGGVTLKDLYHRQKGLNIGVFRPVHSGPEVYKTPQNQLLFQLFNNYILKPHCCMTSKHVLFLL